MGLIDFILNLAGLILLLNWRSLPLDPLTQRTPATLVGTLRPAQPRRFKRWYLFAALLALVVIRALLYWQVGSPADWTPKLNLGFVVLPFRSDTVPSTLLYSALSLLRMVLIFFSWMMVLLAINARLGDSDPVHKVLKLQFGALGRWPAWLQLLIPPLVAVLIWAALHPLLAKLGLISPARSPVHILVQGLLIAIAMLFTLKYLLGTILFLHLLYTYVYLGSSPVWDFVSVTAANMLRPFWRLHLRTEKLDLAPLVGIVLVFLLLHTLPHLLTTVAARQQITIWPQ